ncbi:unnamed protein product [Cochlearia groenlandica]
MEADGQKLYSVVTREEVVEKMMKAIEQISEVFSLSKSDATIILISLQWNLFHASDRLSDDKEKLLSKLGLVHVWDLTREKNSVTCLGDHEILEDGDYLVSTPFCSHKFCMICWRDNLNKILEKNKNKEDESVTIVLCPKPECVVSIGPDTFEKFTGPVKKMYESYILESFMECNKETIQWCPGSGCEYAIERNEDLSEDDVSFGSGVVCLCGHIFCWNCKLDSHRPVTCNNASLWLTLILNDLRSVAWITENTKCCPRCASPVQRNGDPDMRLITCICSCTFCWRCFRSKEAHNGKWNCVEISVPPPSNSLSKYYEPEYLNFWDSYNEALEKSMSELKSMVENAIPKLIAKFHFGNQDIEAVKNACALVVQCRLVLKWSCVYEYFIAKYENAKKQYMKHLREDATKTLNRHRKTIEELMDQTVLSGDLSFFKLKLTTSTTNTGNYFHEFVKNLECGLLEVKIGSCDDSSSIK